MTPAEQAATFCSVLLDDLSEVGSGLFCNVWGRGPTSEAKVTRWLPVTNLAAIVEAVHEFESTPGFNTYLGMGFSRERRGPNRRIRREDVAALTCVWVEIDIAGHAHAAATLPTTVAEATRVLNALGLAPSMIWNSGHGLQAVWLLDEPWIFGDGQSPEAFAADHAEATELLRDWRGSVAVHAHQIGRYKVDAVHDLSRVLRIPGTTNRKIIERVQDGEVVERHTLPEVPAVLMEHHPQRRYSLDDLRAHMVDRKALEAFRGMSADGVDGLAGADLTQVWRLVASYAPRYEPEWLTAFLYDSPERFREEIWANGHPSGDSETDASIARYMAMGGAEPIDAVEAIYCYRMRTGRKLDKVDPRSRLDYVVNTVNRAFGEQRKADEAREAQREAQRAAVQAQEAEARRLAAGPVARDAAIVDPLAGGRPGLAPMIKHHLEHGAEIVVADGCHNDPSPATPPADAPPPPVGDPALTAELPVDEPRDTAATEEPPPASDIPDDPPPARDPVALLAEREGPGSDGTGPSALPPANPWGTRTESQTTELDALTEMLLTSGRIWRLLERGRGAKMERRLQLRVPTDHVWITAPPADYRPGYPFHTGWWPAAAFNQAGGFIAALRQDAKLITRVVAAQEFNTRFADSLVRLWEPDERAGSLANVALSGISNYLVAHAPSADWAECAAGATPHIVWSTRPRWDVDGTYEVWVRWSELCRYIRTQQAQQVTPQVSAELIEISHSTVAASREQQGQWYKIDSTFLAPWMWEQVIDAGRNAEARRQERRGMHLVQNEAVK